MKKFISLLFTVLLTLSIYAQTTDSGSGSYASVGDQISEGDQNCVDELQFVVTWVHIGGGVHAPIPILTVVEVCD